MGQAPSGQACRRERKEYDDAKIAFDIAEAAWKTKYSGPNAKKNMNDSLSDGQKLEALRQDMVAKKRNLEACEKEFELH
jgi:hypothetical protein